MSDDSVFLRTLYIEEQGSMLRIENERFRVTHGKDAEESELIEIPSIKVGQIVIFGACMITPAALRHCLTQNTPIVLLSQQGKYYSRIESTDDVNIALERLQFERSSDETFLLECSRNFVRAKLHNSSVLLKRHAEKSENLRLNKAIADIHLLEKALERAETIDAVRGYEGQGAAVYFSVFQGLFESGTFTFKLRVRRPPTDPVNAMLSFGYSMLFNNIFIVHWIFII